MLLVLVIAQFAVWAHATHIAQAAASQALSATRVQGANSVNGEAEASAVLRQLGGALHFPRTVISRDAEQSRVEITGEASSVVPFLRLPVVVRVIGPTERFVPENSLSTN
jgi:hypothetical protein